jgi:NAD(P)H dehydrogenase (quinone)
MTRIVITGASGQYGRAATERLVAQGRANDLILITRSPAKLADRASQGCDVRYGDFDKPETLADSVQGADTMMLISGTRVGARVVQHQAAIDAAAAAGVRHIVYTSFIGIHPDNPALATRDHAATETLIRASGCNWTMLRDAQYADAMIINSGPNFIRAGEWRSSSGDGRAAMVWRDDCVACATAVLTSEGHAGRTYNITGPDRQTFAEVCAMMSAITGRAIDYVETDDAGMYAMFDAMGIPREPVDDHIVAGLPWNSDDMVTFEAAIRGGWLDVSSNDVEKLTGQKPRSVRQMIEQNAEMLRAA